MVNRLRVSIGGALGATSDWSNTLEFALSSPVPDQATLQTVANAVYANLAASSAVKPLLCTDTNISAVKLLFYPNGSTVSTMVAQGTGAAIVGTSTPVHAPQVCIVASLRTAGAGGSYRGRIYVPHRGAYIAASGVVSSSGQTNVAAFANGLKSAVVAACASSNLAAVWGVYSPKLGALTPINAVLVGSQCDTIRHRNRNRNETYISTAVSTTQIQATPGSDFEQAVKALENAEVKISPLPQQVQDFATALLDVVPPEE